MNCKQMYQNLAITNFFIFKYNLNTESSNPQDILNLEIPN